MSSALIRRRASLEQAICPRVRVSVELRVTRASANRRTAVRARKARTDSQCFGRAPQCVRSIKHAIAYAASWRATNRTHAERPGESVANTRDSDRYRRDGSTHVERAAPRDDSHFLHGTHFLHWPRGWWQCWTMTRKQMRYVDRVRQSVELMSLPYRDKDRERSRPSLRRRSIWISGMRRGS